MTNQKTSIVDTLVDWRDMLDQVSKFIDAAETANSPLDFIAARKRLYEVKTEMSVICKQIIAARVPAVDTQNQAVIVLDARQVCPR